MTKQRRRLHGIRAEHLGLVTLAWAGAVSGCQLEEPRDRLAGEILEQERELTRILVACALGEMDDAKRRAAQLLAEQDNSIYAPPASLRAAPERSSANDAAA